MNRINILASLCKGSNIICDIGCDHGFVVIEALKYYGVKRAIASDIAKGPLENASLNISDNNLLSKVDLVLSNGFDKIDLPFDTAIIAGMGGNLIKDILSNGLYKIKNKKIIVEANNYMNLVREYLTNNGFIIENEVAIYDKDKYYEIAVFVPGVSKYSQLEYKYGPVLVKNKDEAFITHYKNRLASIYSYINKINDECKKQALNEEILEIKNIIGE